jgi:hypothetical protein
MIITQIYNTVKDIDREFIPSLEQLLSNNIPSFQYIEDHEQNAPEDINFAYYLFFGNQTNAPIGFAQLELKNEKLIKPKFLKRIFKKKEEELLFEKSVKWSIPGSLKEGLVFKPQYMKNASETAALIVKDLNEREDILSQEVLFSEAYNQILCENQSDNNQSMQKSIPDTLIKNQEDYQSFFNCLENEKQKELKVSWKKVQKGLGFKLGEYDNFKTSFEYKDNGATQYKQLKNNHLIKKYLKEGTKIEFLTLETSEEIKAMVIFIYGKKGNAFYDIVLQDEKVPKEIPHQMAIIKFYDAHESNRLHFAGEIQDAKDLTSLGYTIREQFLVTIQKRKK